MMSSGTPSMKSIGAWLGILTAAGTVAYALVGVGAKIAASDFVTVSAADQREVEVVRRIETRIASGEALVSQREAALAQRIEELGKSSKEANDRLNASIDRIYNLLLQGRH